MINLKKITAVVSSLMLFSNVFVLAADDLVWPEGTKAEILKLAKEQDRFVLLFVGNYNCPLCQASWAYFNQNTLRQIIEDNYNTWFFSYYEKGTTIRSNYEDVKLYIADYDAKKFSGVSTNFPILALINPDDPDEDFTFFWGRGVRTFEELYGFITSPPDLFAGNTLTWYGDEDDCLKMAKEQGKYIFKLVGKATSPNTKKVLKHLNEEPLKSMLEDNYILWFTTEVKETTASTYAEDSPVLHPYISIIYPDLWDTKLESSFGYQDAKALETIIKKYTVSNETIIADNQVTVSGNIIQITNRNSKEQIKIFSLSGQQVASIRKNGYTVQIDASSYPKGVLVVAGSSGWSKKIIVQ